MLTVFWWQCCFFNSDEIYTRTKIYGSCIKLDFALRISIYDVCQTQNIKFMILVYSYCIAYTTSLKAFFAQQYCKNFKKFDLYLNVWRL